MSNKIVLDNELFTEHLTSLLSEMLLTDAKSSKFIIKAVFEENKPHDSEDDFFRLLVLGEENIGGKELSLDDTIAVLSSFSPRYPTKIKVEKSSDSIITLFVSTRLRKPSQMPNATDRFFPFVTD